MLSKITNFYLHVKIESIIIIECMLTSVITYFSTHLFKFTKNVIQFTP